jgi:hypothetical protein
MWFRFSAPFDKWAGPEIQIGLDEPLALRTLIVHLSERVAGLRSCMDQPTDVDLNAHIAFIRKGRTLKLEEVVYNDDVLDVLLPATGG